MRSILLILLACFLTANSKASTISSQDKKILESFWVYAQTHNLAQLPTEQRITRIGQFFLGYPYKSGTLNVTKEDLPVINLHEMDCVTLVDNVLALAFLSEYNNNAIGQYIGNITKLRYRNGEIVDYASRMHYSSDWLYEMQRQQLLTDVTSTCGGVKHPQYIDFMSRNYLKYPVLVNDRKLLPKIKAVETDMNKRTYYYIPKGKIAGSRQKIMDGDVVLITTNIKGLDTSHLGFAVKKNGKVYLLHASSVAKKVVLSEVPLQDYMAGINSQTGIMLGRVQCVNKALPDIIDNDGQSVIK